ncbi:MAG: hypothetical protein ACHQ2E_11645, partial [Gemmatimonadales bacterium]
GGDYDLWDLKALFQQAVALAVPGVSCQVEGSTLVARLQQGQVVGSGRRVEVTVPPWAAPVFGFEVAIDLAPEPRRRFRPLPATPAIERDLALVLPAGVTAMAVESLLGRGGGRLLESVEPFDEYRGKGLGEGARSVAFHLTFRDPERTLREEEVEAPLKKALALLEKELGVQLRTS